MITIFGKQHRLKKVQQNAIVHGARKTFFMTTSIGNSMVKSFVKTAQTIGLVTKEIGFQQVWPEGNKHGVQRL
jgi:hypothetical protein